MSRLSIVLTSLLGTDLQSSDLRSSSCEHAPQLVPSDHRYSLRACALRSHSRSLVPQLEGSFQPPQMPKDAEPLCIPLASIADMERSVVGTTVTARKLDGTTAAATFSLDSATAPTSVTRSS